MFSKLNAHLKWIVPAIAAIILLVWFWASQSPKIISATVSPETALSSTTTGQTLLNFKLKLKGSLPVLAASLKTLGTTAAGLKVSLTKQADGSFTGSVKTPPEWLNKPQTITFGLYVNGTRTSGAAGAVRFAITDIPAVLPPDPGEAGKQTLEGIDSDQDGVRDDLQREIVFMYPDRDEVRRVLRAMVKKQQDVITTTGDHEHFKGLISSELAFKNCYRYLVFGGGVRDYTNGDILWKMLRNTDERKKKDEDHNRIATPYTSPIYSTSEACTQPLVQGQY